jgi:DNA-binding NarL/FixJ family response regulator
MMDVRFESGMDGIEAARRIREHRAAEIIYMTAYPLDDLRDRLIATDPAGLLTKPVTADELHVAIQRALHGRRTTLQAANRRPATQVTDELRHKLLGSRTCPCRPWMMTATAR